MRYLHLINCCLSTFGPYFVVYKATSLSSSAGVLVLLAAVGVSYVLCQLCKTLMLIILGEWVGYVWIIHQLLNLADLPAVYFLLQLQRRISSGLDTDARLVGVGLGWALAEAVGQNVIPILAEGNEFGYKLTYRALVANLQLVAHVSLTALVHMSANRKKQVETTGLRETSRVAVTCLLFTHVLVFPALMTHTWELGDRLDTEFWLFQDTAITPVGGREDVSGRPRPSSWTYCWLSLLGLALLVFASAIATKLLYRSSKLPAAASSTSTSAAALSLSSSAFVGSAATAVVSSSSFATSRKASPPPVLRQLNCSNNDDKSL